ncbi:TPA: alpha-L-arabinofuranosidase, partial [Candidatus Sumerlaeota bacterium]|nr:alpha-L-arabinofuranosidase [Candidatus Sumerlaeota bacterium]
MTGMERNSDVVEMCSYAPLFVNPGWQSWNPNAIVFDSAHAYGTPSYHVQALFGNNKPDVILPVEMQSMEEPLSPISGSIGLGSYSTQVEYKDIKVTGSKGEILFNSKGMKTLEGWKKNRGAWAVSDGVIKQVSNDTPTCILLGDKAWNNYTLTLKARKDSGAEGFQILFDTKNTESPNMWNIGGWQNTKNSVEWDPVTEYKQCSVEAGRWYDVKIEVSDKAVKCYLDGQLLHDVARPTGRQVLHTVAGYKQDTKEVIVKVVNGTPTPRTGTVTLAGSKSFVSGKAIVLANSDPDAENTFAEPQKVAPKEEKLEKVSDNKVERTFPANSVTVLRLQEKK